jgi:glycosyltransferase involved in cell wall biosynthesis
MAIPKYSVVIPLYNKKDFIEKSVFSALNQTYHDIEVIVVDDGSSDSSVERINGIKDERLRVLSKLNGGVSSARNYGIKHANGQYIAFLDADDEYELTFLENIENTRLKFNSCEAIATAYFKVTNGTKTPSFIPRSNIDGPYKITKFYENWSVDAFFFTSSIVVKRAYFYTYNKWFPDGESLGEDQEIWFSIYEKGQIVYLPIHLSNYNMGVENSLTNQKRNTEELPFVQRLKQRVKSKDEVGKGIFISKYELERAFNSARVGNKKIAFKLLMKNIISFKFFTLKMLVIVAIILPRKKIN